MTTLRIGTGFDAHPFTEGRPLILGGVAIPYPRGLAGHSDADVLLHAVSDAILGALGSGDIGQHFPDADPANRGIDSAAILRSITRMMAMEGFRVVNVDTVVIAEEPKIALHAPAIKENIGKILGVPPSAVGVKGKTTERMGFTGRGEGMAAMAVALLSREEGKGRP